MSNSTIDYQLCTLATCPLSDAYIDYIPSLGGNAFYLAVFVVLLCIQILLGIRSRTWSFMGAMIGGLILEAIGYGARIQMHNNPFDFTPFLTYLICLTIGPTFLSAGIYVCLARIIVVYGEQYSRFKPRTYTLTFIVSDFVSLVLQATGGAIADTAYDIVQGDMGVHIMVAGLSLQVASLLLFLVFCAEFAWRLRVARASSPSVGNFQFKAFLYALALATLFILIRSCFRVAELSKGFGSALANDEITFMILEGGMVVSAVLALTIFHPGRAFDGGWAKAGYKFRTGRKANRVPLSYHEHEELKVNN